MLTALLLIVGGAWTVAPEASTPEDHVLLHVRLERPDGSVAPLGTVGRFLRRKVLVQGRGEVFQVDTDTASSRTLGPGWDCYVVPKHSEVYFAATLPPFGHVEHVVQVGEASPEPIHLRLREVSLPTLVVLQAEDPAGEPVDFATLTVRGPETGIKVGGAYCVEGRCLVLLPPGDYVLQLRNRTNHDMGCDDTETWFHRPVAVSVGGPARALHLQTEVAGRLRLLVVDPDRPGPLSAGRSGVRARLVAVEPDGLSWNPRWCYESRRPRVPTLEVPLGVVCTQSQPLPFGDYLLLVTGESIDPVTVPVTLGTDEPRIEVRVR